MQAGLTYLSLGAGVQSSAMFVMSALGLRGCPRAEVAVYADTQDEPKWVYAQLQALEAFGQAHGLPIVRVTAGKLSDETYGHAAGTRKRRAALPVFTLGDDGREAMLPRQCTEEYKLAPIRRYLRQRLGVQPRTPLPKGAVEALIGISFEERDRIKESGRRWIVNRWPLIESVMRKHDCIALLEAHGVPVPNKSACIYCPFHDDAYWLMLREQEPEAFADACRFDEAVRSVSRSGLRRPIYLHRSLTPLRDVTFKVAEPGLDFSFRSECGGSCGT